MLAPPFRKAYDLKIFFFHPQFPMNYDSTDSSNLPPPHEAVDQNDGSHTLSDQETDEGKNSDTDSCRLGLTDIAKIKPVATQTTQDLRGKRTRGVNNSVSPPTFLEQTVMIHSRCYCLLIYNTFCCGISFFCLTFSGLWLEQLRLCLRTTSSHAPS